MNNFYLAWKWLMESGNIMAHKITTNRNPCKIHSNRTNFHFVIRFNGVCRQNFFCFILCCFDSPDLRLVHRMHV